MSALERIAELHTAQTRKAVDITPYVVGCAQCFKPWPCPTRRLCDEGGAERDKIAHYLAGVIEGIEAARDAARADADRLAAAVRVLLVVQTKLREKTLDSDGVARFEGFTWTTAFDALCAALAAHDAARTGEGPNGFAIEDLCDADD